MDASNGKRRLVQSTLFPHKDRVAVNCNVSSKDEELEDEEWCASSSQKKRQTNRKANVKKKQPPSNKVTENAGGTTEKQVGESDSPVVLKSSFFVKASEKRLQKGQQNQPILIDFPKENDVICSPPNPVSNGGSNSQKMKRRNNSTPKKEKTSTPKKEKTSTPKKEKTPKKKSASTPNKKMKSGARELRFGEIPFDLNMDDQPLQTPDLRSEAKRMAEENSRLYSGKQIHPFFTSIKGGKTSQDSTYQDNRFFPYDRKEKGMPFNPVHVLENSELDNTIPNWDDWVVFSEGRSMDGTECGCSSSGKSYVDTLSFDNMFSDSHLTRISLHQKNQCSTPKKEVLSKLDCLKPSLSLDDMPLIWNELQELNMLPSTMLASSDEVMSLDHKPENPDFLVSSACDGDLVSEIQEKLLLERITSHYHTSHSMPENSIWTDKYKPQNAQQICGNGESVKLLSEWLHLWHQRDPLASKSNNGILVTRDTDTDYQLSDSDSDTIDGEDTLKNVLLVTGPVGCGKSAAIYACARDQGFQVIEINASDWRNGALIKQKFGEAVESHWQQRIVENTPGSVKKTMDFTAEKTKIRCLNNEAIELIDLSDKDDSQDMMSVSEENKTSPQNEIKNLILFEDVDIMLVEDHGFITTIQQLAETAKRPMILTSNSECPVLPKNLERSELNFSLPLQEELLDIIYKICAAEETKLQPCLGERFVDYCQRDIRKTIMLLQFWFQGPTVGLGKNNLVTYSPVVFDLDAGHHILPKLIPWGYPSKLSELVEKEIVESLHLMEANNCRSEDVYNHYNLQDPSEAKKEAMLNLHRSFQELEDPDFQDHLSGSPITLTRKNRRKVILSSDSEDGFSGSRPIVSDRLFDIDVEVVDISYNLTEEIHNFRVEKLEECSRVNDACESCDMSFVPESSFVPETEFLNESDLHSTSVSYGHFIDAESKFIIQDQNMLPTSEPASGFQFNNFSHVLHDEKEPLVNVSDANLARAYQEEIGDSVSKSEADFPLASGFKLFDECSRVDFRRLNSLHNTESENVSDYVHEAWTRLRDPCKGLRNYVTQEEITASQALEFTHGISNLISEADLLLKDCQTQISDSSKSSPLPSEKMHSHSYYDDQMEMSSVIAQHGTCFYAKEIFLLGSTVGFTSTLDMALEMLSNSSSSIALGKLARANVDSSDTKTTINSNTLTRNTDSFLGNILESVVPSKAYLAAKGYAYHEYISTLSQISRFESSRVSDCLDKKTQRRGRVPRHYLSSGSLAMSSEDITLLGQYNSYQKVPLLGDESCR